MLASFTAQYFYFDTGRNILTKSSFKKNIISFFLCNFFGQKSIRLTLKCPADMSLSHYLSLAKLLSNDVSCEVVSEATFIIGINMSCEVVSGAKLQVETA
jgi:hypothetical protein